MAQAARITLQYASSHESSFGKFTRKGQHIETQDKAKIAYYSAQSEFDISFVEVRGSLAGPPPKRPAPTPAPKSEPKSEPEIDRRPWNDKMSKADLLAECVRRGLGVTDLDTRGVLMEQLREDDKLAAGGSVPLVSDEDEDEED